MDPEHSAHPYAIFPVTSMLGLCHSWTLGVTKDTSGKARVSAGVTTGADKGSRQPQCEAAEGGGWQARAPARAHSA